MTLISLCTQSLELESEGHDFPNSFCLIICQAFSLMFLSSLVRSSSFCGERKKLSILKSYSRLVFREMRCCLKKKMFPIENNFHIKPSTVNPIVGIRHVIQFACGSHADRSRRFIRYVSSCACILLVT